MIDQLLHTYLFRDFEYETLNDIAKISTRLALVDGDVLIHENEIENFDLFVLCNGFVEIISSSSKSVSGDVVISNQDMAVFGEISWLTHRKRTATVRCRGDVDALRIDGKALSAYLESHPQLGYRVMLKIAGVLAERVVSANTLLKQILWNSTL